MKDEFEKTFCQDSTEFLDRVARFYVLDSVRCEMHNKGYELEGNTEENDVRWLARYIFDSERNEPNHWDRVPEEVRERYLKLAQVVLTAIPRLMSRISARCLRIAEAVNTTIKAEKLQEHYNQQKKHPIGKI